MQNIHFDLALHPRLHFLQPITAIHSYYCFSNIWKVKKESYIYYPGQIDCWKILNNYNHTNNQEAE